MTMQEPLVSAIIPTFNRSELLKIAHDSVCNQTYENIEIIVIDDGSVPPIQLDQSEKTILLRQEQKGVSVARNLGIQQASGKYIAFLDSDDVWLPDKLRKQIQFMESHPEVAMTYTGIVQIDEYSNETGGSPALDFEQIGLTDDPLNIIYKHDICTSTVVLVTENLHQAGWFDPLLSHSEDYDLFLRVALFSNKRICYMPERLSRYRKGNEGLSSNTWRSYLQGICIFSRYKRFAQRNNLRSLGRASEALAFRLRRLCCYAFVDDARKQQKRSDLINCLRSLVLAFYLDPSTFFHSIKMYLSNKIRRSDL